MSNATYHFHADNTVIYCCTSSVVRAFELLQFAFNVVQPSLKSLKLVLNANKSKKNFSNVPYSNENTFSVKYTLGTPIEVVTNCKYLGFLLGNFRIGSSFLNHILKTWLKSLISTIELAYFSLYELVNCLCSPIYFTFKWLWRCVVYVCSVQKPIIFGYCISQCTEVYHLLWLPHTSLLALGRVWLSISERSERISLDSFDL